MLLEHKMRGRVCQGPKLEQVERYSLKLLTPLVLWLSEPPLCHLGVCAL